MQLWQYCLLVTARLLYMCSGNRPRTSLLDIYHPDPWHAPGPATTVLVLLMMDAESVQNYVE